MRCTRVATAVGLLVALGVLSGCASGSGAPGSSTLTEHTGASRSADAAVPPSALDPGAPPPDVPECPPLTPEQIEAGDRAAADGDTVDPVDYEHRFGRFVEEIRSAYPDDYATARVEGACRRGFVTFKDDIPLDLLRGDLTVENITLTGGAGLSEKEVETLMPAIFEAALSELPAGLDNGGYDWAARAFRLNYVHPAGEAAAPIETELDALRSRLSADFDLPDGIRILVSYDPAADPSRAEPAY